MALVDQLEAQLAASRATAEKLLEALVAELTAPGRQVTLSLPKHTRRSPRLTTKPPASYSPPRATTGSEDFARRRHNSGIIALNLCMLIRYALTFPMDVVTRASMPL